MVAKREQYEPLGASAYLLHVEMMPDCVGEGIELLVVVDDEVVVLEELTPMQ